MYKPHPLTTCGMGLTWLTLTRKYYILQQIVVEAGTPYKEFSGVVFDIFDGYTCIP